MSFNGSGLFQRLYSFVNDAANSINIRADRMDAEMDGIASGLSNCITRDGQGKPSAAIDWNGQNLSNVNALTAASGAFTGAVNGATGTFSGAVTAPTFTGAVNGTTGTFSGAVTAASAAVSGALTGGSAAFSGAVTAATPATGNRSTSVATTQMFSAEFLASISDNGYQKLPSGLILQWGKVTTTGALVGATWTFPIAFPNRPLLYYAMTENSGGASYYANIGPTGTATTATTATISSTYSGTATNSCFALGY